MFGSDCKQVPKLFHGSSAEMERENAIELFRESKKLGFRYMEYVCDGDIKVVSAVNKAEPYGPGVVIEKTECANHLKKRSQEKLLKWGTEFCVDNFNKREKQRVKKLEKRQKKEASDKKKADRARAAQEKAKGKGQGKGRQGKKGKGNGGAVSTSEVVLSPFLTSGVETGLLGKKTKQTKLSFVATNRLESTAVDKDGGRTTRSSRSTTQDIAVEEPSSVPCPSSSAVPRTGSGDESGRVDQMDGPIISGDDLQGVEVVTSNKPLPEIFEHPIGNPASPYDPEGLSQCVKKLWPGGKYPLKNKFGNAGVRKIGAKFHKAIYSHNSLEEQKRAVMSVPWHELDYQESSLAQKEQYHYYCDKGKDSWCQFQAHVAAGHPPENFVEKFTKEPGKKRSCPLVCWT